MPSSILTQGSNLRLLLGRQILYHRTSWEEVGGELAKQFVCGAGPQRCLETAPREAGATGPRGPGLCVSVEKGRGKAGAWRPGQGTPGSQC